MLFQCPWCSLHCLAFHAHAVMAEDLNVRFESHSCILRICGEA